MTTFATRAAEFREGLREVVATPPILIAAGIEAVMYLGYGAFLGFLPIYAKTVGLNDAEIAIVLASQLATAVVAKPIGGRLSDGLGRKPVIVIGLLLCAAALPLIFRSESLATFIIVAPLLGLAPVRRTGPDPRRRRVRCRALPGLGLTQDPARILVTGPYMRWRWYVLDF